MDTKLARTIGRNARTARERARLTQAEVAERLGVATDVYGRLERGRILPRVVTLCKLATLLTVPADLLLGLSEGTALPPLLRENRQSPDIRRLIRRVGALDRQRLRLLNLLADVLGR